MTKKKNKTYHHGGLREALLTRAAEVIQTRGIEALTLRGLAKDLEVSHGAPNNHFKNKTELLLALATESYADLIKTLIQAADTAGEDSLIRLNAMGKAYLHWALDNPASFRTITHPDLAFYANDKFHDAQDGYRKTVRDAVIATQKDGRLTDTETDVVSLFTTSVPIGAALILSHPTRPSITPENRDIGKLISDVIDLVVPIN